MRPDLYLLRKFSLWLGLCLFAGAAVAECNPKLADIRFNGSQVRFEVELADNDAERAQGLMFRDSLPPYGGMLFVYDRAQPVSFWMKNTLIPLDMLFFDEKGVLVHIHENAIPGDLTPIPGRSDVKLVLEINAGASRELGLAPGAELRHSSVDASTAAWGCVD